MRLRPAVAAALAVLLAGAVPGVAGADHLDRPAEAGAGATRAWVAGDLVSVSEPSDLSAEVEAAAAAAAYAAGGAAVPGRAAQVGMVAVRRQGAAVQLTRPGYRIPMGVTALPVEGAYASMGPEVARVLARGELVLSEVSAALRGAQAGDTVDLLDPADRPVTFTIGALAPAAAIGGAEFVMRLEDAGRLGVTRTSRVLIFGFDSRAAIDAALAGAGLVRDRVRIGRSWDAPSPDAGLGLVATKVLGGEFEFRPQDDGGATIPSEWVEARISPRITYRGVGIRAACNVAMVDAIQGALLDVAAAGLAGAIDLANTNTYGGCFNPRLNRITGNLGFLSRHAWGIALDMNTLQNAQGRVPRLDCGVVRIFRKWGFAWGGNFLVPDGMHFEYVGERRDTLPYASRYCPNVTTTSADRIEQRAERAVAPGPGSLFAADGLPDPGHDHDHDG